MDPCTTLGQVHWYVDGRLVHSSDAGEVVVGRVDGVEIVEDMQRGSSTLTVVSSGADSEAQYTCRVRNRRGTAFTNAHLFVLGKHSRSIAYLLINYLPARKGH